MNFGGGLIMVCKDIIVFFVMLGWVVGVMLIFIICVGDYVVLMFFGGGLKFVFF